MFGLFGSKKRLEAVQEDTKKGFEAVKKDISSVSGWIKHLDSEKNMQKKDLEEVKQVLSSMEAEIEGLKNVISLLVEGRSNRPFKQAFKTNTPLLDKQTPVYDVQTGVQTGVQTPDLSYFSLTERAILLVLLNTDMKLSYEDLAAMLGKEKSTIRGQINAIKSKSESLIEESVELNGKKRIYIPEKVKEKMLKKVKVRIKKESFEEKSQK